MSLSCYSEYKDSGIASLGNVPSHWRVARLKQMAGIQNGRDYKDVEAEMGGYPVFGSGGEFARATEYLHNGESVLLGRKGTIDRPLYINGPFWTADTMFYTVISSNTSAKYLYYCALTIRFDLYSTNTALPSMTQADLGGIHFAVPCLAEQEAIVAFLDRETSKIDALISEQEKLIMLLAEKRQATISHAVTKGLNPNAPMKDSGVAWLGEIPEFWACLQLGRLCRQVSDGPHFSPSYVDEGVMFLSARNVKVDGWSLDDAKYISEDDYAEFCKRVIPKKGDVLYTKGGTTGIARVVDLDEKFQVWVHIAVLKIDQEKANPYFIAFALNSIGCYEQSQLYTRGATNNDLGLTRLIKIWLTLPSMTEQSDIVTFLQAETTRLDALSAEAKRGIALLNERRSAIISAAVTGKIDVRQAVQEKQFETQEAA